MALLPAGDLRRVVVTVRRNPGLHVHDPVQAAAADLDEGRAIALASRDFEEALADAKYDLNLRPRKQAIRVERGEMGVGEVGFVVHGSLARLQRLPRLHIKLPTASRLGQHRLSSGRYSPAF